MTDIRRRELLTGTAFALLGTGAARAGIVAGQLPWAPDVETPPPQVKPGPWKFFTAAEAQSVEALADRIIPPDAETPGGKGAGCAVFLDRQLAGPYGSDEGLYEEGPFLQGTATQGAQSSTTPAELYRRALAALDDYARAQHAGGWTTLSAEQQDAALRGLEDGSLTLAGVDGRAFFDSLIRDVKEGFFADPSYGGNKDMCSWKMIGFPGARYDYREWVGRHNERFPLPPVSIVGRPAWIPKG